LIAIALVAVSAWFFIERVQHDTRAEALLSLSALVEVIETGLNDKHQQLLGDAQSFAQHPETVAATRQLLDEIHSPTDSFDSAARQRIRRAIQPLLKRARYQGFLLIGPGNIDLLSSLESRVHSPSLLRGQSSILERAWAGERLTSEPQLSEIPVPGLLSPT